MFFWSWNPEYNCDVNIRYTSIGSNIHRQKFIFSSYDKVRVIAFDVSFNFNMVLHPKAFEAFEETKEFFNIHISLFIDMIIKVTS